MTAFADTSGVLERAVRKLERDMGAPLLLALNDPGTVEIALNADGVVWQERLGEQMKPVGFLSAARAQAVIETVAGCHGKEVTRRNPILEAEFPLCGSRFAGQIPPIVTSPVFAIRKRASSLFTLDDYVQTGNLLPQQREQLIEAVKNKRNILVTGGTGSGKTTMVNAIINEMSIAAPHERILVMEDTGEIRCTAENRVQYFANREVGLTALLRASLRMRPDRILVGEVRGPEALDLLMAWNTGHEGGVATLHANSARAGLDRLALLASMNDCCPRPIEPLIGEAAHLLVHMGRTLTGRKVEEILEVYGFHDGNYVFTRKGGLA